MTLWHIWIFDLIAWVLLAVAIFLVVGIWIRPLRRWLWGRLSRGHPATSGDVEQSLQPTARLRWRLELIAVVAGIVGGYLAVYMAYGTLRNQSMLAAKTAINADAGRLLDWERTSTHIRCLYNWYSTYDDGDACLAMIATDRDLYSEVSLYIEEVFFIFKQARSDEQLWRSGYIESIAYWRAGVEEDPTGLFSNYLATVNAYTEPANTRKSVEADIQEAGIKIKFQDICDAHHRVRACFQAAGQDVRVSEACKEDRISTQAARSLPKLIATCKAAAQVRAAEAALGATRAGH